MYHILHIIYKKIFIFFKYNILKIFKLTLDDDKQYPAAVYE